MKKLLALFLMLALVLTMFVACDKEDNDDDEKDGGEKTSDNEDKDNGEDKEDNDDDEEDGGEKTSESNKSPEELILGNWECTLDLGDYLSEILNASSGTTLFDDLSFEMKIDLEMKEDSYVLSFDETVLTDSMNELKNDMKPFMMDYLEDVAKQNNVDLDDIIKSMGFDTADEYIDAALEEMNVEDMLGEMGGEVKGSYELDGDKIFFIEEGGEKEEDNYATFEVNKDTLKLSISEEQLDEMDETEMSMLSELLPLTFKRK